MKLLKQEDKRYKIDYSKPVKVYKNLHKDCWSIQQNGLVKAHSDEINLFDCKFLVNEKDRQRVIKTNRKNVHAFVVGHIWDTPFDLSRQVKYNPYNNPDLQDSLKKLDIACHCFSCRCIHNNRFLL